jgi:hypothetical protein
MVNVVEFSCSREDRELASYTVASDLESFEDAVDWIREDSAEEIEGCSDPIGYAREFATGFQYLIVTDEADLLACVKFSVDGEKLRATIFPAGGETRSLVVADLNLPLPA